MKKPNTILTMIIAALIAASALPLAACGNGSNSSSGSTSASAASDASSSPAETPAAPDSNAEGAGIANPMVEYDTPDFTEKAGFAVTEYPADYTLEVCFLIGEKTAELDFTIDGVANPQFRIAVGSGEDISGVYGEFESTHTEDIGGVQVKIDENAMADARATWERDGYMFSLYMETVGDNSFLEIAKNFVENVTINPPTAP